MQFAILGSHPALSLAEIKAVTKQEALRQSEMIALFENLDFELTHLQQRLGGTQKFGEIIATTPKDKILQLTDLLTALLESQTDKKIKFGISLYSFGTRIDYLQPEVEKLGLTIKNNLKERSHSARFVTSSTPALSSVVVTKNKLLQNGAEFVLLVDKDEITVGQTVVVQDFADWSKRDYQRPARDARRGMLPPKLARMMINLAGVEPTGKSLLDPFCGSGTVLMEGALLGFEHLIGSDISEDAVQNTEENLAWLEKEGYVLPQHGCYVSAAAELDQELNEKSIDVIVTEPFLGKPRQGTETEADLKNIVLELTDLYQKSFKTLAQLLKPSGVMVTSLPVHFIREQSFHLPIQTILNESGLKLAKNRPNSILYHRQFQFVGREIVVLEK